MKLRPLSLLLMLLILLTLSAHAELPLTLCDDTGHEVTLVSADRVAALSGSLAQIWLLSGGELCCATDDAWTERDLGLPDTVQSVGSLKSPSAELLLSAEVDLVLLTPTLASHVALGEVLTDAGVTCLFFDVETFDDYLRALACCTAITGQTENYARCGTSVQAEVDKAVASAEGHDSPTVLLLRAYSTGVKAKNSDNNMVGAMLHDLGCVNIADSDGSLLEDLTLEKIIAADPDFIFITTMGADDAALARLAEDLQASPAWEGLTAVQNGRCHVLPKALFHYKPCDRWGESYAMLLALLYGEA